MLLYSNQQKPTNSSNYAKSSNYNRTHYRSLWPGLQKMHHAFQHGKEFGKSQRANYYFGVKIYKSSTLTILLCYFSWFDAFKMSKPNHEQNGAFFLGK